MAVTVELADPASWQRQQAQGAPPTGCGRMIDDTTGVLEYVYVFCFIVEVGLLVSKVSVWYYVVYYVCWVASPRTSSILGVSLGAAHNNNLDSRFIYQV